MKKWWFLGCAALVLLAAFFGAYELSRPAQGTIQAASAQPSAKSASSVSAHIYHGKYYDFNLRGTYSQISTEIGPGYLDNVRFVGPDYSNSLLVASVREGLVGNEAGVTMRQSDSSYVSRQITVDGVSGLEFTKRAGGFEQTVFIQKGKLLVTVALSSTNTADLSADLQQVLTSWRWNESS